MAVDFARDRTQNWKTYFPIRNGVNPETFLKEGRNYTNETLYYMSKSRIAKAITDKVESYLDNSQYFLIDICAGIGGNTLEFLSRKNCISLMAFERNPTRRLMLQRNISGYKLGYKAIVPNGNEKDVVEITGEEDFTDYPDSVFFFDPPWLPENFKAGSDYKKHYILKDMKVGLLTLEEWLEKLIDTAYIVNYRVPPEYVLTEVKGYTYVVEELGNDGRLYICIPNRNIKGMSIDEFGGYITTESSGSMNLTSIRMKMKKIDKNLITKFSQFINSCNAQSYERAVTLDKCKMFVKWGFVDPEPLDETPKVNSLAVKLPEKTQEDKIMKDAGITPIPPKEEQVHKFTDIPKPSKNLDLDSPEWVSEFQVYLAYILSKFLKKKEVVNDIIGPEFMPIWVRAFTHESLEPDRQNNYELTEIIGDSVIRYVYINTLIKKFGNTLDQNIVTSLKSIYISKEYQVLISKSLGIDKWIRARIPLGAKEYEDVSESFFGALDEIGNKYKGLGYGISLCQKFMNFLVQPIVYNPDDFLGNTKQKVKQRMERALGGNFINYIEEAHTGSPLSGVNAMIILKEAAVKKFIEWGFTIPDGNVIGQAVKPTKVVADNAAYEVALSTLNSMGFTAEFAAQKQLEKSWNDVNMIDEKIVRQAKSKLSREGYDNPVFDYDLKNGKYYFFFNATNTSGTVESLGRAVNTDQVKAKIEAIRMYLDK